MADPTTFPEEHVSEPLVYRRLSGFAIAAVIVAGCDALIVLFAAISGLSKGMPVLLPPWMQALALVGAGLAIAGLVHVRRSEDTVAGTKLALWGLLISALFGLSYGAYYTATYFAIRQQAYHFTQKWFRKLEEGKINSAFLDTQDPGVRQRITPEDEDAINNRFQVTSRGMPVKPPLESFREHKLVRRLVQGGPSTRITPLGVKDWGYSGGGYKVQRSYHIETDEGKFDAQVTTLGLESKMREYEGREWQIVTNGTGLEDAATVLSPQAVEVANLQYQSSQFLEEWGNELAHGDLGRAYLNTREPAERPRLAEEFTRRQGIVPLFQVATTVMAPPLSRWSLLAWIASVRPDELARQLWLPDYVAQFSRHGLLQSDKFRAADVDTQDNVLKAVRGIFRPVGPGEPHLLGLKPGFGSGYRTWKIEGQRLVLPHDCRLAIAVDGKLRYTVEATIIVESDPGPVTASRKPAWRIVSVELRHGEDVRAAPRMGGQAFN